MLKSRLVNVACFCNAPRLKQDRDALLSDGLTRPVKGADMADIIWDLDLRRIYWDPGKCAFGAEQQIFSDFLDCNTKNQIMS